MMQITLEPSAQRAGYAIGPHLYADKVTPVADACYLLFEGQPIADIYPQDGGKNGDWRAQLYYVRYPDSEEIEALYASGETPAQLAAAIIEHHARYHAWYVLSRRLEKAKHLHRQVWASYASIHEAWGQVSTAYMNDAGWFTPSGPNAELKARERRLSRTLEMARRRVIRRGELYWPASRAFDEWAAQQP